MTTWLKLTLAAAIGAVALLLGWWLQPGRPSTPRQPDAQSPNAEQPDVPAVGSASRSSDAGSPPSEVRREPDPLTDALCPQGMVWVSGDYCVAGFESERGCRVAPATIGVCMDAFEYPNQPGVLPAVMATFAEAERACFVEGKRLCTDSEWTLGCRDTAQLSACVFGAGGSEVRRERLWDPLQTQREVERVDERRPSGKSPCVSARAVFDLPGNVEEWARGEAANGYDAVLKGGHFNKGSIGCERSVYTRQLDVRSPFVGFRCCRDPLVSPPAGSF